MRWLSKQRNDNREAPSVKKEDASDNWDEPINYTSLDDDNLSEDKQGNESKAPGSQPHWITGG